MFSILFYYFLWNLYNPILIYQKPLVFQFLPLVSLLKLLGVIFLLLHCIKAFFHVFFLFIELFNLLCSSFFEIPLILVFYSILSFEFYFCNFVFKSSLVFLVAVFEHLNFLLFIYIWFILAGIVILIFCRIILSVV